VFSDLRKSLDYLSYVERICAVAKVALAKSVVPLDVLGAHCSLPCARIRF
jgi:hypothetical protein